MIYQGIARYPVHEVLLHASGCNTGQYDHMTPFQVFSVINQDHIENRGFKNGFGYHGLFMPDGTFYEGRPVTMIGAHCIERNRGSLGYLMIESKKIIQPRLPNIPEWHWLADREPLDWFTQAQIDAVKAKIATLSGILRVSGHNDYARKLCPGFKVQSSDWLT